MLSGQVPVPGLSGALRATKSAPGGFVSYSMRPKGEGTGMYPRQSLSLLITMVREDSVRPIH